MSFSYDVCHWPKLNVTPGSKVSLNICAEKPNPEFINQIVDIVSLG